jgi:hypothetical protein
LQIIFIIVSTVLLPLKRNPSPPETLQEELHHKIEIVHPALSKEEIQILTDTKTEGKHHKENLLPEAGKDPILKKGAEDALTTVVSN